MLLFHQRKQYYVADTWGVGQQQRSDWQPICRVTRMMHSQPIPAQTPPPKLRINPDIKTLDDIESWVNLADFVLTDYQHHEAIRYAFAV